MKKYGSVLFLILLVTALFTAGNFRGASLAAGIGQVDINRDNAAELQKLPGIGPAMAQRIIEYREANGPFERIEDLMEVKGIGEKRFLTLRDLVTVGSAVNKTAGNKKEKEK